MPLRYIMPLKWMIILTVVQATQQKCAVGCLRCDSTDVCQFCDTLSGYFLRNGVCVNSPRVGCELSDQTGGCVLCGDGFRIDPVTRGCLPVQTDKKQPDCMYYTPTMGCDVCRKGFFVVEGRCEAVTVPIPNCWVYQSATQCRMCEKGHIQSPFNATQCVAVPSSIPNCMAFNFITCRKCRDDLVLLSRKPTEWTIAGNNAEIMTYSMGSPFVFQTLFGRARNIRSCYARHHGCNPLDDGTCLGCLDGQYLDKNQCKKNPFDRIENCRVYSDLLTCTNCLNGFYLESNTCKPVASIANCINYDGSVSASTCTECREDFFVSANACVERTKKKIENCVEYSLTADECVTCGVGSMINSQRLVCLFSIDHCLTYADTESDATQHNCQACRDGFYPLSRDGQKVCVKGTVPSCLKYDQNNTDFCSVCLNGYFLSSGLCQQHVDIDNCRTYDQSVAHQCNSCDEGFIRLRLLRVCVRGRAVPNCKTPLRNLSGCEECLSRFYLDERDECLPIPMTLGNCLSSDASGSSCVVCADGQVLFQHPTYKTCLSPPDFITAFGELGPTLTQSAWDTTSSSQIPGDGLCSDFSYPVQLKSNDGLCVRTSQLKFVYSFNTVSNCRRYSWNPTQTFIFCSECNEGYYITDYDDSTGLTDGLRCSDSCDLSANLVILNDLLGLHNICALRSTINWTLTGISSTSCTVAIRKSIGTFGVSWDSLSYSTTLQCLVYEDSTTVPVWSSADVSSYTFDVDLVNSSNAYKTDVPTLGYHLTDRKSRPFVFNYGGCLTLPALKSGVFIPALTSNCNLYFKMKSGSAYASSGRDARLVVMTAAKEDLVCLQCEFGYLPKFTEKIDSLWVYAPKCSPTTAGVCNSSIVLGGLPSYLNAVLSCHSCANGYVPRVKFEMLWSSSFDTPVPPSSTAQNRGFFLQYTFSPVADPFACHNPSATVSLFNVLDPTAASTNADCGVYGDISRIASDETTAVETKSFCLACNHGHSPHYFLEDGTTSAVSSVPNFIVESCSSIANCDLTSLNKPFNSCGKCISQRATPASSTPFFAFSDLLMRKCNSCKTDFCFVLKPSDVECMVCQSGHYLNGEGRCDAIVLPNMQEGATFNAAPDLDALKNDLLNPLLVAMSTSDSEYSAVLAKAMQTETTFVRLHHLLSFSGLPNGPTLCRPDYSIVPLPKIMNSVCAWSPLLKTGSVTNPSYFVSNCQKYFNSQQSSNESLLCSKCIGSFISTSDFRSCVSPIANCEMADASNPLLCEKCLMGFSNLIGVCSKSPIDNCVSYFPKETQFDSVVLIVCEECVDEYYWDPVSQKCVRNPSLNCRKFVSSGGPDCIECLKGHVLTLPKGSYHSVCVPLEGVLDNCDKINTGSFLVFGGFISCNRCVYSEKKPLASLLPFFLSSSNNPKSVCIRFNSVTNCVVYDIKNTGFENSSFDCLECGPGFYAQSNACVKRNVMFEGCAEYHKSQDLCLSCVPGMVYVSHLFPQCVPNPEGVPKCIKYSDASTCVKCADGYYLANNLCLLSTERTDCLTYSANYTCSGCRSDYFVNSTGFCAKTKATDCLTIASVTACQSCPSGKGLKRETVGGVELTSCVDNLIDNCLQSSEVFPFKCLVCDTNYYPFNDTCSEVDPLIPDCLLYESVALCSQCKGGFSLSVDRKTCQTGDWIGSLADSDCVKLETLLTPVCSMCQPGYSMVDGVCSPTLKENPLCIGFHPTDPTTCLLCQPKTSWMNSKGLCVAIVPNTIFVPEPNKFESLRRALLMNLFFVWMNVR